MIIGDERVIPSIKIHPDVRADKSGFKGYLYTKAKRMVQKIIKPETYTVFNSNIATKVLISMQIYRYII